MAGSLFLSKETGLQGRTRLERGIARINLTKWPAGLWNWSGGGIWKALELWAEKGLRRSKGSYVGHSGGGLVDQDAKRNPDRGGRAYEVPEGE